MQNIKLTKNKYAIVDDEDFELLNRLKWYCSHGGYAVRDVCLKGVESRVYMHRILTNAPKDLVVDHINGNGLDNRKENLRLATREQNTRNNQTTFKRNTSGFRGVDWQEYAKSWRVCISVKSKSIHIGMFKDRVKAARAYDAAAIKYHGEFATTNEKLGNYDMWGSK